MGLYFRRSVRVGPLRFNFSGSGIGVSAGIPDFRVGAGPRGAYVHMGAGGLYYRQSLGSGTATSDRRSDAGSHPSAALLRLPEPPDTSVGPMQEIESTSVLQLGDSSSQELLEEIRRRQATPRLAPWIGIGAGLLLLLLWRSGAGNVPLVAALVVGGVAYWWASAWDALRRTIVIGYDLDADAARGFEALMDAIKALDRVGGLWHVEAQAQVYDRKYHAGASNVIKRDSTRPTLGQPPTIRTNLDVPALSVGKQRLYFFPDRLLVFEGAHVGAVSYQDLQVERGTTQFIEDGAVPQDAEIVGRTWRYVNKKGGPDRRFKDNCELPIAHYETIHFQSASGLNELLHASRVGVGDAIALAAARMARLAQPAPRTPAA